MNKWIKANELPDGVEEVWERVLVMCHTGLYAIGYKREGIWFRDSDGRTFQSMGYEVTHYQFLPPKPPIHTPEEKAVWDNEIQ